MGPWLKAASGSQNDTLNYEVGLIPLCLVQDESYYGWSSFIPFGRNQTMSTQPESNAPHPAFTLRHTLAGHRSNIHFAAWSPDGRRLASASVDRTIRLWDGQTGKALQTLEGHTNAVTGVAWSPDGRRLASASDDKTLRLWDGQTGKSLQTLEGHTDLIWGVAWSPDGQRLASASFDRTIRLWDGQTGQSFQTLEGHTSGVLARLRIDGQHYYAMGRRNRAA